MGIPPCVVCGKNHKEDRIRYFCYICNLYLCRGQVIKRKGDAFCAICLQITEKREIPPL